MNPKFPNYNESILNLICSVLKHFTVSTGHTTLPAVDTYLNKNYRNVVVMVFDALGSKNLMNALPETSFLRKHMIKEISSVFPPTTTAATTTLMSGLAPAEHAWLGWSLHFPEVNDNVNIFINTNDYGASVADYHVANKFIPYKDVIEKINETGLVRAESVSPFGTYKIETYQDLLAGVEAICKDEGRHYIYSYWKEPDYSMHLYGVESKEALDWINQIDSSVEELSERLEDTLLLITADHGHIDGKNEYIGNYIEILSTLRYLPSIEPRALAFYVKEEKGEEFKKVFMKYFGEDFLLLSRDEVIEQKLFGDGDIHPRFHEFVGDYLAIAIGNKSIFNTIEEYQKFVGVHAGLTENEMMVPLIVVECR